MPTSFLAGLRLALALSALVCGFLWSTRPKSSTCGLQRFPEEELTAQSFAGLASNPAIVATNRTYLDNVAALRAHAGHIDVLAGASKSLSVSGDVRMRLGDFLQAADDVDYVFFMDPLFATREHENVLARFFNVPDFLGGTFDPSIWRHYLLVGRPDSYVLPHSHGKGWNLLIYGTKRWTLSSPLYFEEHVCTQRAGELIWIPDHWEHQVENLEHSVGVAFQTRDTSPPPAMLVMLAGGSLVLWGLCCCCCRFCFCRRPKND